MINCKMNIHAKKIIYTFLFYSENCVTCLYYFTLDKMETKVICSCQQYRTHSILLVGQLQVVSLISLNKVMECFKNGRWFIPLKKFKTFSRLQNKPCTFYLSLEQMITNSITSKAISDIAQPFCQFMKKKQKQKKN